MLQYYLRMEPGLFRTAVEDQFQRLKEEAAQESEKDAEAQPGAPDESLSLSRLSARIEEVKHAERRATVEDLMYLCVLEEFIKLGVSMLSKMDNYTALDAVNMEPLMSGIHSQEAIDMVGREGLGRLRARFPP